MLHSFCKQDRAGGQALLKYLLQWSCISIGQPVYLLFIFFPKSPLYSQGNQRKALVFGIHFLWQPFPYERPLPLKPCRPPNTFNLSESCKELACPEKHWLKVNLELEREIGCGAGFSCCFCCYCLLLYFIYFFCTMLFLY